MRMRSTRHIDRFAGGRSIENSGSPSPSAAKGTGPATLLLEAEMKLPLVVSLPHGTAVILTHPNPLRGKPNQDSVVVLPVTVDDALLAVADGMGGTRGGGRASGALVTHLADRVPADAVDTRVRTAILNGIECVNEFLIENVPDAGTTLAAVEIHQEIIRPYHIGDSVIFVVGQRGKLKMRTVAHSPVGFAVEAGLLSEEEALYSSQRNLILNAVGFPEMRIELGAPLPLARNDTMLLASDGLTDNVRLEEIIALIRKGPLDQAVGNLATLALERMMKQLEGHPSKPDDLTIIGYRRSA